MTELSSKLTTRTDIEIRFELPTKTLNYITFPPGDNSVDLLVTDRSGNPWTFSCRKRRAGYRKPSLSRGWLSFVRSKGIRVGDRVIFRQLDGGELTIEVKRETTARLFGRNMWAHVEDAHLHGVA